MVKKKKKKILIVSLLFQAVRAVRPGARRGAVEQERRARRGETCSLQSHCTGLSGEEQRGQRLLTSDYWTHLDSAAMLLQGGPSAVSAALLLYFCLLEPTLVLAFNLDTSHVIRKNGEPGSLFGFSLAMHRQLNPDKRM